MIKVVILGSGGHARVLIDAARSCVDVDVRAIVTADRAMWGMSFDDVPVVGCEDELPRLLREGVCHFLNGVGGVGNNDLHRRVFENAKAAGLRGHTLVHPAAIVSTRAAIGEGSVVLTGAKVIAGARIGSNVILGSGCLVEHDCVVEDHAHIGPQSTLCGAVTVETMAHVGANSAVKQGLVIGSRAIVGLGAAVVESVPPGCTVMGVPARIVRRTEPQEGQS